MLDRPGSSTRPHPLDPRRLACLALFAALAGCAPIAAYRGPVPAPGAVLAFAGEDDPRAVPPRIAPGSADRAAHRIGRLETQDPAAGAVVILLGDNRPGFRMEANSPAYAPVKRMVLKHPGSIARGLPWLPVFLVNAILPTLDGPRDFVTSFTKRPGGGGERAVLRAVERQRGVDLVVNTGDVVFDGRRGRLWEDFARRSGALRARSPYLVAPGNHERTYQARAESAWAAVIGPPPAPGRLWYSLDVPAGGARFVFLDSNVLTDPHDNYPADTEASFAEAQLAWADSALAAPFRFKFVVMHHPLFSTGHYANDWGADGVPSAPAARRARLIAMCLERGVSAVITGHEHGYRRLWIGGPDGRGFWHVVTAGGGSPLYGLDRAAIAAQLARPQPAGVTVDRASDVARRTYHFCRLELPAGAGGEARLRAFRPRAGEAPFDEIVMNHPPETR